MKDTWNVLFFDCFHMFFFWFFLHVVKLIHHNCLHEKNPIHIYEKRPMKNTWDLFLSFYAQGEIDWPSRFHHNCPNVGCHLDLGQAQTLRHVGAWQVCKRTCSAVLISIRPAKETYKSSLVYHLQQVSIIARERALLISIRPAKETYKSSLVYHLQQVSIIARERALLVSIRPAKETYKSSLVYHLQQVSIIARERAVLVSIRPAKETYKSSLVYHLQQVSTIARERALLVSIRPAKETYKSSLFYHLQQVSIIARERALLVSIRPAKELL